MKLLSDNEIKEIELEILVEFHNFCKKHNLYYTLSGGTLLGAIRHRGFIPWDDDIDVMMYRSDYNRLIDLLRRERISEKLDYLLPSEEYLYPFMKIFRNDTVAKMEDNNTEHGIWIDIFPLDNLPSDTSKVRRSFLKSRFYRSCIIAMTSDLTAIKKDFKWFSKLILKKSCRLIGYKRVLDRTSTASQRYNQEETEYIGGLLWGYGIGEKMNKVEFFQPNSVKFENYEFTAPSCWEEYLIGIYGNYNELPPLEKRKGHGILAYMK